MKTRYLLHATYSRNPILLETNDGIVPKLESVTGGWAGELDQVAMSEVANSE